MKLLSIRIQNYRSIDDLTIPIQVLSDGSYTYWLIWVNEAWKSTILKAIALFDDHNWININYSDFQNKNKNIEIVFSYQQADNEIIECNTKLMERDPMNFFSEKELKEVNIAISFSYEDLSKEKRIEFLGSFLKEEDKISCEKDLLELVYTNSNYTIFWEYADKYLINNQISLSQFSSDPENISIPLFHCFELCGYDTKEKISSIINEISIDSTEMESLQEMLWEKVTSLIKNRWKNHQIIISFQISGDNINFHIKDGKWKKAKTTSQRSDWFKQFVSFLLNISIQGEVKSLSNTLILLDEPETHLHPQAQEYFLNELINLTKLDNNICYFATHSNYMIDKNILSRNFRVLKDLNNDTTSISQFNEKTSTYASINYEVFWILDESYHNELYDILREKYCETQLIELENLWVRSFDEQYFKSIKKLKKSYPEKSKPNQVTLPTFIRNCIHYPVNKKMSFNNELRESIDLLRTYY